MMKDLLEIANTLLTTGIFGVLLGLTWKGSAFVQWVKSEFKQNTEAHARIEKTVGLAHRRIDEINKAVNGGDGAGN